MNLLRTLPLLLVAAGASAQAVFPSDHATVANGTGSQNWFPYSYGVSRMMGLYESWDVTVPASHQITRIGFRADGTTIAYGRSLQLEVRMGTTDRTVTNVLSNFDNNYLGAPTTVFGPALFVMPDLNNVLNPNPSGPIVWLTLTTPFTFDPTHNLLVEWRVYANNNGGAAFNYALDRATFLSPIVSGPLGCTHSGNQIPDLESRPTKVGGNWIVDLYQAPASQPLTFFINVGLPLTSPFSLAPLFPGIPAACTGQVSPISLFSLPGTANTSGYTNFVVPIPNNRTFNDAILSTQAFCFDFFSPGGLVVSNGDQMQIGIDPAMSIVWHQGNATNATGNIYQNFGVVTLFDHN